MCVELGEVDVDFVLYGEIGLVLCWVIYVCFGDCVLLLVFDVDCVDSSEGWEWRLLVGVG